MDGININVQKSDESPKKPKKSFKPKMSLKKMALPLAVLIAVAGIGAGAYFYSQYNEVKNDPTAVIQDKNQEESERVIGSLQQIIKFTEEDPTVARIEDPTVLQDSNPDFYSDAVAGDYLVLFPARAIIYRESNNQIINVAPIINTDNIGAAAGEAVN